MQPRPKRAIIGVAILQVTAPIQSNGSSPQYRHSFIQSKNAMCLCMSVSVSVPMCISVYVLVSVCVGVSVYVYICLSVYGYVSPPVSGFVSVSVSLYVCVCVCVSAGSSKKVRKIAQVRNTYFPRSEHCKQSILNHCWRKKEVQNTFFL